MALILAFSLTMPAFAATYDIIESTHGTHAKPGTTVYTYTQNGKTVSNTKTEVINTCPMAKFKDLYPSIWCHEGMDYVISRGYMQGKTATRFEPDSSMTRAMIVTVLYRIAADLGFDVSTTGSLPFTDTPHGVWYYDALKWAYKNNIAKGFTKTSFAPNNTVTREQITLFIYRFAGFIGDDTKVSGSVSSFTDVSSLSIESKNAISWAVAHGVLNGYSNGEVRPKNTATRAHFASMLQRWMDGRCTSHSYKLTKSISATCTSDGGKYYTCSTCGTDKYVRIPAASHKYGVKEIAIKPTCTSDGKYNQICASCGKKISGKIPALGHSYGTKQIGKAASCTEAGTYVKVCSNCGDRIIIDTIPVTEHSYIEQITKNATCTETGIKDKTCSVCGNKLSIEIPLAAHSYVDGVCEICGKSALTAIKVTELSDGDNIIITNPASMLSLGTSEEGLCLSAVPVSEIDNNISVEQGTVILTVEKADNGIYFKNPDGTYLSCLITEDGSKLCFTETKSSNACWTINGSQIICTANRQYLECRNNFFGCYDLDSHSDHFDMAFYKLS